MGTATTTTTPESAVEALMKQVADENGLEITENLASVPSQTIGKFIFSGIRDHPFKTSANFS